MPPTSGEAEFGSDTSFDYLQARFRIEPHSGADCQIVNAGNRNTTVKQTAVTNDEPLCKCIAEISEEDGEHRLLERSVSEYCICPVFYRHDCIATVESVGPGEMVVTIAAGEREEFVSIISALRELGATVRLLQLTRPNDDTYERVLELEADAITNKQREAVRAAVESGYYDTPRKADLGDLADQLGVSRSAVSQRLTAVESKLITGLFEADGGKRNERSLV